MLAAVSLLVQTHGHEVVETALDCGDFYDDRKLLKTVVDEDGDGVMRNIHEDNYVDDLIEQSNTLHQFFQDNQQQQSQQQQKQNQSSCVPVVDSVRRMHDQSKNDDDRDDSGTVTKCKMCDRCYVKINHTPPPTKGSIGVQTVKIKSEKKIFTADIWETPSCPT